MNYIVFAASLASLVVQATAQSPAWGQCGGQSWAGSTSCVSGYSCTYSNPYYSQCIPGVATVPSTSIPTTTTAPTTTTSVGGVSSTSTATSTSSGATPTGSQIRAVQAPVFHFYLQNHNGIPVLGPESSSGYFTIGSTISLNNPDGSKLFLNLDNSGTASYKPLTLGTTATTTNWGLEGDTIITVNPRQLNFIACATSDTTIYDIFLQTGNDTPAGRSCTLQTIHLPCLC